MAVRPLFALQVPAGRARWGCGLLFGSNEMIGKRCLGRTFWFGG